MVDPIRQMLKARVGVGETLGERIAQTLASQRDLYVELGALARRQSEFVATGQAEELMAILTARAAMIEKITPLDKELQPYKGHWQEVLDGLPEGERAKVGGLLMEVQKLLADILAQDEADKESLTRQKQQVGDQIGKMVSGSALNRAYGVKPRVSGGLGKG